jgi:hypothetical protein
MSAITESARGEDCQMRFWGVCNGRCETVVWMHANGSAAGKGIGMKSIDDLGAYGCSDCHDLYDRRRKVPEGYTRQDVELAFHQAHQRSYLILKEKGLVGRKAA